MLLKWSTLIALIVAASAAPTPAPASDLRGLLKSDGFTSQQWKDGFAKAQALVASLNLDQKVRSFVANPLFRGFRLTGFIAAKLYGSAFLRAAGLLWYDLPLARGRHRFRDLLG